GVSRFRTQAVRPVNGDSRVRAPAVVPPASVASFGIVVLKYARLEPRESRSAVRVGAVSEPARTFDLEDAETAALAAGAGGVIAFVLGLIVHSRALRLLGLLAAVTGGGLYARGRLAERSDKIEAAKESVHSAIDDLDPVARAQVLADIARSE